MHGLVELLLVKELEDEEDEVAAQRQHCGGGEESPPDGRSARSAARAGALGHGGRGACG